MSREVWPGGPFPLGPTWDGQGTNFSLFSEHATRVELCLFDADDREERIQVTDRTAFNWHCYVPGVGPGTRYGYRVYGPVRARGGPPLQPGQAAHRSVRQGDRGGRRLGRGQRAALRARSRGPGGRRPRARRRGLRARDPQVAGHRRGLRLGGRHPPAHAVEPDGHLRGARQGLHASSTPRCARTCAAPTAAWPPSRRCATSRTSA